MGRCSQTPLSFSFLSVTTPINTPSLFCPLQLPSWDTFLSVFLLCFPTTFKTHLKFFLFCFLFLYTRPLFPYCKNNANRPHIKQTRNPSKVKWWLIWHTDAVHSIYLLHCGSQFKYIFPTIYRQTLYSQWGCVCAGGVNSHYGGASVTALKYQFSREEPQESNYR